MKMPSDQEKHPVLAAATTLPNRRPIRQEE